MGLNPNGVPFYFEHFYLLKTIEAVSFQSLQKICGYFVDAMQALCVLAQFFGGDPQEYLPLHTLKMLLHQQLEFIPEFRGAAAIRRTLPIQIISPLPLKIGKSTARPAAEESSRCLASNQGVRSKINKKFVRKS